MATQFYFDLSKGDSTLVNYRTLNVDTSNGNRFIETDKGKLAKINNSDFGILSDFLQTDPNIYAITVKSTGTALTNDSLTLSGGIGNGVAITDSSTVANQDLGILSNEASVLESVKNVITTEKKSRIYTKRDFGTALSQYLFNPIDIHTSINIYEEIEKGIIQYEPRALNPVITVTPKPNLNTFYINISFEMEEADAPVTINTELKKLR